MLKIPESPQISLSQTIFSQSLSSHLEPVFVNDIMISNNTNDNENVILEYNRETSPLENIPTEDNDIKTNSIMQLLIVLVDSSIVPFTVFLFTWSFFKNVALISYSLNVLKITDTKILIWKFMNYYTASMVYIYVVIVIMWFIWNRYHDNNIKYKKHKCNGVKHFTVLLYAGVFFNITTKLFHLIEMIYNFTICTNDPVNIFYECGNILFSLFVFMFAHQFLDDKIDNKGEISIVNYFLTKYLLVMSIGLSGATLFYDICTSAIDQLKNGTDLLIRKCSKANLDDNIFFSKIHEYLNITNPLIYIIVIFILFETAGKFQLFLIKKHFPRPLETVNIGQTQIPIVQKSKHFSLMLSFGVATFLFTFVLKFFFDINDNLTNPKTPENKLDILLNVISLIPVIASIGLCVMVYLITSFYYCPVPNKSLSLKHRYYRILNIVCSLGEFLCDLIFIYFSIIEKYLHNNHNSFYNYLILESVIWIIQTLTQTGLILWLVQINWSTDTNQLIPSTLYSILKVCTWLLVCINAGLILVNWIDNSSNSYFIESNYELDSKIIYYITITLSHPLNVLFRLNSCLVFMEYTFSIL